MNQPDDCIVRITDAKGNTLGTGFLVSTDGRIATCYHVVPGKEPYVAFPGGEPRPAPVIATDPIHDVAILQLEGELPPGTEPARLGRSAGSHYSDFRSRGYRPLGEMQGIPTEGRVLQAVSECSGVQYLPLVLKSQDIRQGMSGAPVYLPDLDLVVGMITGYWDALAAKTGYGDRDTVLATPSEAIVVLQPSVLTFALPLPVQDYLAAVRNHCDSLPYLALQTNYSPETNVTLNDTYVPPKVRPRSRPGGRQMGRQEAQTDEPMSIAEMLQGSGKAHILILGEAGTGKSTLLRQIASHACDAPASIGLEEPHLPLLIQMQGLATADGGLEERFAKVLPGQIALAKRLPEGFFTAWPKQTGMPWMILMDGLDEVPTNKIQPFLQWLKDILKQVEEIHVVITCRASGYLGGLDDQKLLHYELLPFTPKQRKEFAVKFFDSRAENFLAELEQAQVGDMGGTPLFLMIAASVYENTGCIPRTRTKTYEMLIDTWLQEAAQREGFDQDLGERLAGPHDLQKARLSHLALRMTENPGSTSLQMASDFVAEHLHANENFPPIQAEAYGQKYIQVMAQWSGIYTLYGNAYNFAHSTIREYLCALTITKLGEKSILHYAQRFRSSLDWRGVFAFTSALLDEQPRGSVENSRLFATLLAKTGKPQFLRLSQLTRLLAASRHLLFLKSEHRLNWHIEHALQRALFCAAACLAEDVRVNSAILDQVFSRLEMCIRSQIIPLCALATKALAGLKGTAYSQEAAEIAIDLLAESWYKARKAGAEILGELGTPLDGLESDLVQALADPHAEVRRAAAVALGKLGIETPLVQDSLFRLVLTDREKQHWTIRGPEEEDWVDGSIVRPGEFVVIPVAADALKKLDGATPFRLEKICQLLQSPDPDSRQAAACALGKLGKPTPKVVAGLIQALNDTYRAGEWGESPEQIGVHGTTRWIVLEAARSLLLLQQCSREVVAALANAVSNERSWSNPERVARRILEKHGTEGLGAAKALVAQIPHQGRGFLVPETMGLAEKGEGALIQALLRGGYAPDHGLFVARNIIEQLGYLREPSVRVYRTLLSMLYSRHEAIAEAAWISLNRQTIARAPRADSLGTAKR